MFNEIEVFWEVHAFMHSLISKLL